MTIRLTEEVGDGQDAKGDRDSSCQHHLSEAESTHNGTGLACSRGQLSQQARASACIDCTVP